MNDGTHRDGWLAYMKRKDLQPNTQKLYTRAIETLEEWASGEDLALQDLERRHLEQYLDLKAGSASSVCNRISAFRSYYRYLARIEARTSDPTLNLDAPKRRKGVPKPIDNLPEVLDAMDREDIRANEKGNIPRRVGETRDMAIVLVETGLRIHEARGLKVDVPAPDAITIIGKGRKEAIVLLTEDARQALNRLGGHWPIGARATQRRFEKVGIHPHALRHTFATRLVRKGVEIGTVSKLCRHSSPAITMVYAQYDHRIMRAALEKAS